MRKKNKDIRVRLDEDLKEEAISKAVEFYEVENTSQLVRKLLKDAVRKSRGEVKKAELRLG